MTQMVTSRRSELPGSATEGRPEPTSTTVTLADANNNDANNQHSDKTGLWGLVGLLGLGGLAGLRRRRDTDVNAAPAANRGRGI